MPDDDEEADAVVEEVKISARDPGRDDSAKSENDTADEVQKSQGPGISKKSLEQKKIEKIATSIVNKQKPSEEKIRQAKEQLRSMGIVDITENDD